MGVMPDPDNAVVLVADGEETVLQDVSSTLEKAGYKVFKASTGAAVHDFCACPQGSVQLAIVDMAMVAHAPDTLDQLYRSFPDIRILFTGGREDAKTAPQVGRPGSVREFLGKPFRRSQLLGRVLQVMDAPMAYTA